MKACALHVHEAKERVSSERHRSKGGRTKRGRERGVLRKDPDEVLIVGVSNLLNQVLELVWEFGSYQVTLSPDERVNRSIGERERRKKRRFGSLRFTRFSDTEDVGDPESLQDFELPRRLERTDVESYQRYKRVQPKRRGE
jgi:hypothetical protein